MNSAKENGHRVNGARSRNEPAGTYHVFRAPQLDAEDLRALLTSLRKLQRPYGETFWLLEQQTSRIEDELERRTS